MAALAGGLAALVLGIIGIIYWGPEFIDLVKGGIPIMLILGGLLAAYLSFEEIKHKDTSRSFDNAGDNLKDEVETLKEEIKGLKEEKKSVPEKKAGSKK
ncbi:MAG: hypothetical protein GY864_02540 [Desulfobacterales bacterium]|nr:hypothetical protein [Desulfobacterales bacterium]